MTRATLRVLMMVGCLFSLTSCGGSTAPAGAPTIGLSNGAITFSGEQSAASPGAQTLTISNAGTGKLTRLKVGDVTYDGIDTGWVKGTLNQTSAPATLTLTPSVGSLQAGTYSAIVPILSDAATNNPQLINVSLLVYSPAPTTHLTHIGDSQTFLDSANFATNLTMDSTAQYLVAVVNTNPTYTSSEGFNLDGVFFGGATAQAAKPGIIAAGHLQPAKARQSLIYPLGSRVEAQLQLMQRLAKNHIAALKHNREVYTRFRGLAAAQAHARGVHAQGATPLSSAIDTTIGAVSQIYVNRRNTGSCADVDSVNVRTVARGQHVLVVADTNQTTWPDSLRPDSSFYQNFADEYDQVTWPHLLTYIGNPLEYDSQLSNMGRVTVAITPLVNAGNSVAAFVDLCDFYPKSTTGSFIDYSNQTEIFYSWAPSAYFDTLTWGHFLRATAAHETKHIVSFSDRLLNNSPNLEEIWLEEGLAQVSSEIWLRHFNGTTWKGSANFNNTVACELNVGLPCDASNTNPGSLVFSQFPFFFDYLANESQANSEGLGADVESDYGAGWTFARWAIDQYASSEGTFIQSLIDEPSLTGVPNLSAHTAQPGPLLLTYWNMASAIYDTVTTLPSDPRLTYPTFNFGNIFFVSQAELTCGGVPCGLFTLSGSPVFPVQPRSLTAGTIAEKVQHVPGTAAVYYLISAPASGTQLLELKDLSGKTLTSSSGLRVGIWRVQ